MYCSVDISLLVVIMNEIGSYEFAFRAVPWLLALICSLTKLFKRMNVYEGSLV